MKDLQLVLTNPCSQQWDDLQPAGAGRYCDRCEKSILDLTTKSDAELIQFFQNKQDNVCGRLLTSQLNRKLVSPSSKVSWHWLMPLALGSIVVSAAQAQQLRPAMVHSDQTPALSSAALESVVKPLLPADRISGSVMDELTGKPLQGVKVRQKGFENVLAITDSTGRFELDLKEDQISVCRAIRRWRHLCVTIWLLKCPCIPLG